MAIFTKTELAHAVGKGKSTISMNITRGNLIELDGMINDADATNQKTIGKWLKSIGGQYKPPAEISESRKKANAERNIKYKEPKVPKVKTVASIGSDDLDTRKKLADITFKEKQTKKIELEISKLQGLSMPTKLVGGVVQLLGNSFFTEVTDEMSALLLHIQHKEKIKPKNYAEYKGMLTDSMNKANLNGRKETKNGLRSIIENIKVTKTSENDRED